MRLPTPFLSATTKQLLKRTERLIELLSNPPTSNFRFSVAIAQHNQTLVNFQQLTHPNTLLLVQLLSSPSILPALPHQNHPAYYDEFHRDLQAEPRGPQDSADRNVQRGGGQQVPIEVSQPSESVWILKNMIWPSFRQAIFTYGGKRLQEDLQLVLQRLEQRELEEKKREEERAFNETLERLNEE